MPWTNVQADDRERSTDFHARTGALREITYREAVREALDQALVLDPRVFLLGEGIDDPPGVFGTTAGLVDIHGPDRVMDTPIAENGMTGVAIGAAMTGMRPVFIHMRVDFLLMAMDQMLNHAAKWSYMTDGKVKIPLTIRAVIGRGWGSAAQHSQSLQALFAHVPGMQVMMPASPYDAKGMLLTAIGSDCPSLIIEHRWLYEQKQDVPKMPYRVTDGTAFICRAGTDVTIVATSYMVLEALRAAQELGNSGISAEVLDLRYIQPIDEQSIISSVRKTGRLIVADTGWRICGVGAEVAAIAAEFAHDALKAPVRRVCLPAAPTPASHALEKVFYPTHEDIVRLALEMV